MVFIIVAMLLKHANDVRTSIMWQYSENFILKSAYLRVRYKYEADLLKETPFLIGLLFIL